MNPEAKKTVPTQENLELKNNYTTPQAEKGADKIPDFNERVSNKANKLEQAKVALEAGDSSSISSEELENLKTRLPGFIKLIRGRMDSIKNETNNSNQAENGKKIENLQRLLSASETMQQYFESQNLQEEELETATPEQATPESQNLPPAKELPKTPDQVTSIIDDNERDENTTIEVKDEQKEGSSEKGTSESQEKSARIQNQAESQRNTADLAREKLEKFKNIQEIMNELVKKTEKLNELLSEIEKGEEDIDKKKELEAEIEKILKDIEDLLEQLKEQPEDVNPEDTEKMNQLDSEITRLQEEINANPNSSEAQSKREQLVKLSAEYQSYQNSRADSFNTAQEIVSTFSLIKQKEKGKLNDALKSRVDEVMTNSGTNFGEKFKNIEKN